MAIDFSKYPNKISNSGFDENHKSKVYYVIQIKK